MAELDTGTLDAANGSARLATIAAQLHNGSAPSGVTVRSLLSWFGAQRRGNWIVHEIRKALKKHQLTTEPDFEAVFIDSEIQFHLTPTKSSTRRSGTSTAPVSGGVDAGQEAASERDAGVDNDPTHRIGKLRAANRPPVSVPPDAPLTKATSLMMMHEYSQLPVIQGERTLKGVISWESIGRRLTLGQLGQLVRDAMDSPAEVDADKSLFAAIGTIIDNQYVIVRGRNNQISGIVTASDLSEQFQQLAEPFLLLGEIENHLRRLIEPAFSASELQKVRAPEDTKRTVEAVSDLTFGEYVRLLQDPTRWAKVNLSVDRAVFIERLERVNAIRNDVMHFDPDPVGEEELAVLRSSANFFRSLRPQGS
jgi:CBS domain-containing protein